MAATASKPNLSTPDIPESAASFSLYSTVRINAPAALVFRTLRNTETWKDWNKFCPIVIINEQPPEEDDITIAEIQQLVRNTSLAGSLASDMLDSTLPPGAAPVKRRESVASQARGIAGQESAEAEEEEGSEDEMKAINAALLALPVTRQRLASNASAASAAQAIANVANQQYQSDSPQPGRVPETNQLAPAAAATSSATPPPQSPAKPPAAFTKPDKPETSTDNPSGALIESPADRSLLVPAPPNTKATQLAVAVQSQSGRRQSTQSTESARRRDSKEKKRININALYGEPSVRIQIGTYMTLQLRMGLPYSLTPKETPVVITEVSRPDDPSEFSSGAANLFSNVENNELHRTTTHTMSKSGKYRIVYEGLTKWDPPKSYPHFLLQWQRVHEIRPIVRGDGQDLECEYSTWELQKGMMASKNKKNSGKYLQERYDQWVKGLKEFCESMGGAVERRDFVTEE